MDGQYTRFTSHTSQSVLSFQGTSVEIPTLLLCLLLLLVSSDHSFIRSTTLPVVPWSPFLLLGSLSLSFRRGPSPPPLVSPDFVLPLSVYTFTEYAYHAPVVLLGQQTLSVPATPRLSPTYLYTEIPNSLFRPGYYL